MVSWGWAGQAVAKSTPIKKQLGWGQDLEDASPFRLRTQHRCHGRRAHQSSSTTTTPGQHGSCLFLIVKSATGLPGPALTDDPEPTWFAQRPTQIKTLSVSGNAGNLVLFHNMPTLSRHTHNLDHWPFLAARLGPYFITDHGRPLCRGVRTRPAQIIQNPPKKHKTSSQASRQATQVTNPEAKLFPAFILTP